MKYINEIKNIVVDNELSINIKKDLINISNYKKIYNISEKNIFLKGKDKKIKVFGTNLRIIKLFNDEILVKGKLNTIEVIYE